MSTKLKFFYRPIQGENRLFCLKPAKCNITSLPVIRLILSLESWLTFCFLIVIGSTNISLAQDGTLDATFNPGTGANGTITAIAPLGNGLIIGGTFTSYNGTTVGRIAKLNKDGTLDASFNSGGSGFTNSADSILAIAIGTNDIYVGGRFTAYNGSNPAPDHIIKLSTSGNYAGAFSPPGLTGSATGSTTHVRAIAVQLDGNIIVAGDWNCAGGGGCSSPTRRVMRLLPDGPKDPAYNAADALQGITSGSWVNSLAIQSDGKIIIAGTFTSYNGVLANRIVRVNADGSRDASFACGSGAGVNSPINKVAILQDGDILIAGSFTTIGSPTRSMIARLNPDGTVDAAFNVSVPASITAMCVQRDGKIIIAGAFTTINGTSVNRLARLNPDGTLDTSFNPGSGPNVPVREAKQSGDGKLLIGGNFTDYNGTARNKIARVHNTETAFFRRNAVRFDGVDDFITVNHHANFDVSSFTLEAWIKTPSAITPGSYAFFSKEGATVDFRISIVSTSPGSYSNIRLTSDAFGNYDAFHAPIGPNEWHHIMVSVESGSRAFMIDNRSLANYMSQPPGNANNNYPLLIGAGGGTFWPGQIDEVRFWRTGLPGNQSLRDWMHLELTAEGPGVHYNSFALVGYWQFNQIEGPVIYEDSDWPDMYFDMSNRSYFDYRPKPGTPSVGMAPGYLVPSTAPLGSIGTSARLWVNAAGTYNFIGSSNLISSDMSLTFSGSTFPNGDVVVTHVEHIVPGTLPDNIQIPGLLHRTQDEFWIVHNFSITNSGLNVSMVLAGIVGLVNGDPQLYVAKRPTNSDGNWVIGSDAATGINSAMGQATFGGITSFSQFVPISLDLSPLPIELIDFLATHQGSDVFLKWQTASDLNSDHFIIQHSSDGKEFLPIGRVESNRTTKAIHNYSFTDTKPLPGKNYYRLAQYDLDGKEEYSPIRYLNMETEQEFRIDVYPNPAKNDLRIECSQFTHGARVEVYGLVNHIIVLKREFESFGWNQSLDISSLAPGLYFVSILTKKGTTTVKVVVK